MISFSRNELACRLQLTEIYPYIPILLHPALPTCQNLFIIGLKFQFCMDAIAPTFWRTVVVYKSVCTRTSPQELPSREWKSSLIQHGLRTEVISELAATNTKTSCDVRCRKAPISIRLEHALKCERNAAVCGAFVTGLVGFISQAVYYEKR